MSCVPAFQALAHRIGPQTMQRWLDRLGYGDRDLSAGIDVFWLPAPGRKTLLISPYESVDLVATAEEVLAAKSKELEEAGVSVAREFDPALHHHENPALTAGISWLQQPVIE